MGRPTSDIARQLEITNRLLAIVIQRWFTSMSQQEFIGHLIDLEITDEEIALVVGTTPATVSTTRHRKAVAAKAVHPARRGKRAGGDPGSGSGRADGDGNAVAGEGGE